MRKYERIRNLREDKDLTQTEMGNLLNISQRSYAHYEAGTRNIPIDVLIDIADIFEVSLDYITERSDIRKIVRKKKFDPTKKETAQVTHKSVI